MARATPFRPHLSTLEDRTVPSAPDIPAGITLTSAGTLYVIGDWREQDVTIDFHDGQVRASMMSTRYNANNLPVPEFVQRSYAPHLVQRVECYTFGGIDWYSNDTAIPSRAQGGEGNDTLTGGGGIDALVGGGGNDSLEGRGGDDDLRGGSDDDRYLFDLGKLGTDVVTELASADDDTLDFSALRTGVAVNLGTTAFQTLIPEVLNLQLSSWLAVETVDGTAGPDAVSGNPRPNAVWGRGGDDTVTGGHGQDTVWGGAGHDELRGEAGADELWGEAGDDDLHGGNGNDRLVSGAGDNYLSDGAGDDYLDFALNSEGIVALTSDGDDTVIGTAFADSITGSSGADWLDGRGGDDTLVGGGGADELTGGTGDDELEGEDGADTLSGGTGADVIMGGAGRDDLDGGSEADELVGGSANDHLRGGSGDDELDGGTGRDTMNGGAGFDELYADQGNEALSNGEHVEITVPDGSPQTDAWSCGPNSGSRLLRSYGYDVSYEQLRDEVEDSNIISQFGLGTPGPYLREVMAAHRPETQLKSGATFDELLARLAEGRPVVALIGWGEVYIPVPPLGLPDLGPEVLHYICLTGYDMAAGELYYTDTTGEEKLTTFSAFKTKWDWPAGPFVGAWLSALGVQKHTMIW